MAVRVIYGDDLDGKLSYLIMIDEPDYDSWYIITCLITFPSKIKSLIDLFTITQSRRLGTTRKAEERETNSETSRPGIMIQ